MAAFAYVAAAGAALVACLVLACFPRTRALGRRSAGAVLASGPGILAYQALAVPAALVAVVTDAYLTPAGDATSGAAAFVTSAAILLALGALLVATATGFAVGLRTGWDLAAGVERTAVLRALPVYGRVFRRKMGLRVRVPTRRGS